MIGQTDDIFKPLCKSCSYCVIWK